MLERLTRWWRQPAGAPEPARRQLAMAVLLVETARADFDAGPAERAAMCDQLVAALDLGRDEAEALVERAFVQSRQAVSLHEFLQTLNAELDAAAKRELIERLWQIAHADGSVDPREEACIRQLAGLLFVPHADFVRARLKAQAVEQGSG
ncbi:Uncharacterized conserved protein, tellurite resistance protein B (TerB) family [Fontimonas thermophila]|uniref:Uncharacterized conserved protein, tellurite resistance protein B (TerB) family n=1 Tax=Fontimonas thermophila TaxID=1076937 RepID=A0A1I2J0T8_9GAMM|nr:TerB family tellurite resistance protein [Fontimonas thermophila]SFF48069.1 Uncharacterized conserved protein, tellurite resistance protein B (TerB) family [Fontimonas thermophila]